VSIDDPAELEALRAAGRVVAETLRELRRHVRPGVSTGELDALAARVFADHRRGRGRRPSRARRVDRAHQRRLFLRARRAHDRHHRRRAAGADGVARRFVPAAHQGRPRGLWAGAADCAG
jgi:hypothetical protein